MINTAVRCPCTFQDLFGLSINSLRKNFLTSNEPSKLSIVVDVDADEQMFDTSEVISVENEFSGQLD